MLSLLTALEIFGILANALSGILEARRKHLDLVGVYVAAFVTAFGGGTLRDILLDRRPFFWVQHQEYALIILALAVLSFVTRWININPKLIAIPDALGLGLYAAVGASYALELNIPIFIASLMGVITAVFGGVIRDIICNEIPTIFRKSQLYATCAFIGCWVYLLLNNQQTDNVWALTACISVTFALRMLAIRYDWTLPS